MRHVIPHVILLFQNMWDAIATEFSGITYVDTYMYKSQYYAKNTFFDETTADTADCWGGCRLLLKGR